MTTEIFQWATVILLALIWATSLSHKGLAEQLAPMLDQLHQILEAESRIRANVEMIAIDAHQIHECIGDNFPTDKQRERAEI